MDGDEAGEDEDGDGDGDGEGEGEEGSADSSEEEEGSEQNEYEADGFVVDEEDAEDGEGEGGEASEGQEVRKKRKKRRRDKQFALDEEDYDLLEEAVSGLGVLLGYRVRGYRGLVCECVGSGRVGLAVGVSGARQWQRPSWQKQQWVWWTGAACRVLESVELQQASCQGQACRAAVT